MKLAVIISLAKRAVFRFIEKYLRLHVTPVHYNSPIPDTGDLPAEIYTRANDCVGLDLQVDYQIQCLENTFAKYVREYVPPQNSGLSRVDALILFAMIRTRRPRTYVEVGCGESTKIALSALDRNRAEGVPFNFLAIEPYPRPDLRAIARSDFKLIERKVQEVELALLTEADILFIDSSHVSRIGSDVNHEILTIVPRLKVGALVHWHDIMIPGEYPKAWIDSGGKFWNESYMLHAFMFNNQCFRVIWAARYLQTNFAAKLSETFPYFKREDPEEQLSSFWIERVR